MSNFRTDILHAFALPTNPNYYNFAACVNKGDTVRFYDSADSKNAHYNAICSDDCIVASKNAILQTPHIQGILTTYATSVCDSLNPTQAQYLASDYNYFTRLYNLCPNSMNYPNFYVTPILEKYACATELTGVFIHNPEPLRTVYEEFSSYSRTRLRSILTSQVNNNLLDPTDRYSPLSSGPLIDSTNSDVINSVDNFGQNGPVGPGPFNLVKDIFTNCLQSDSAALQHEEDNIEYCRTQYISAFGNFVGNSSALTVIPVDRDRKPSMGLGCLYALDVKNDAVTSCPKLSTLCSSSELRGKWQYGLQGVKPGTQDFLDVLNRSICRNYANTKDGYDPFFHATTGQDNNYQTSTQLITAFDPASITQPTRSYNNGVEPSAFSGYLYRSCNLVEFDTGVPDDLTYILNCCANDFADLNGSTEFIPPEDAPPINVDRTSGSHNGVSLTLLGYDYGGSYARCFSKEGNACDPLYRDITGRDCSRLILRHCFLNSPPPSLLSWSLDTNGSGECAKWIGRAIYGDQSNWLNFIDVVRTRGTLPPYVGTKLLGEYLFDIILPQIKNLFSISSIYEGGGTVQDPLQAAMEPIFFSLYKSYNLSNNDNGWLIEQCAPYTSEDILAYPLLRMWCGCFLNSDVYEELYPNIASECTPFCNSSDVIQRSVQCQGSTCIIDDVTVSIINSTTGYISINQFCNACATVTSTDTQSVTQKCNCTISNVNITAISSKVGNISIDQLCNGGASGNSNTESPQSLINALSDNPFNVILGDIPSSVLMIFVILLIMSLVFYNRPQIRNGLVTTLILTLFLMIPFYYYGFFDNSSKV